MDDDERDELLTVVAIGRLQARYGDVVTRQAWAELDDLFVPDAPIELDLRRGNPLHLVGPRALGDMVATAVARFEFFEFALLNSVVELGDGDTLAKASERANALIQKLEASMLLAIGVGS